MNAPNGTVGWGFIGASTIAGEHMVGAVRAQPGHEVVAVASSWMARAQEFAKAGASIADDANVTLMRPDHPFVGRGGVKLTHALDAFAIDVTGRLALDIGASTGGFTDALLQRGAAAVVIRRSPPRLCRCSCRPGASWFARAIRVTEGWSG